MRSSLQSALEGWKLFQAENMGKDTPGRLNSVSGRNNPGRRKDCRQTSQNTPENSERGQTSKASRSNLRSYICG